MLFGDGSLRPVVTGEAPSSSVVTSGSPRKGISRLPSKKPSPAGPSPEKIRSNRQFDWGGFVERVKELNDAVGMQLVKAKYEFENDILHIYPMRPFIRKILSRDNNKKILLDVAGENVKITIHSENDKPSTAKKDSVAEKISDIMGGEVQNDDGGNPFQ